MKKKAAVREQARFNMIAQQIRPWDVNDEAVLDVMQSIPRDRFVPAGYVDLAYADVEIPLGQGQLMLSPKLQAHLLQALRLKASDQVLEVGTGSGFLTACLARLSNSVTSFELEQELLETAKQKLESQGINNISLHQGDGLNAGELNASFDAIAVTGSMPTQDPDLEALLANGGRMFVIEGKEPIMTAMLIEKDEQGNIKRTPMFETCAPALQGAKQPAAFCF